MWRGKEYWYLSLSTSVLGFYSNICRCLKRGILRNRACVYIRIFTILKNGIHFYLYVISFILFFLFSVIIFQFHFWKSVGRSPGTNCLFTSTDCCWFRYMLIQKSQLELIFRRWPNFRFWLIKFFYRRGYSAYGWVIQIVL